MKQRRAPSASLYTQGGQRKYLTAAERARFIVAAERCARPEVKTLCLTMAYTGCRISEALALQTGQVQRASGLIAIRSLKKRSRMIVMREVPVPDSLLSVLEFVYRISTRNSDTCLWTWSRSRAWQLVKAVMMDAGIAPGIHATPKGLRHGFGLHAVRCGVPLNLVQRWLGHASLTTTAIYLQAMGEEEREIAARMWS